MKAMMPLLKEPINEHTRAKYGTYRPAAHITATMQMRIRFLEHSCTGMGNGGE